MTENDIKDVLKQYAARFNREIDRFFPFPEGDEKRVSEAMHYSLTRVRFSSTKRRDFSALISNNP